MKQYYKEHFYRREDAVAFKNECIADGNKKQVRMTSARIGPRRKTPLNYIYTVGFFYTCNPSTESLQVSSEKQPEQIHA